MCNVSPIFLACFSARTRFLLMMELRYEREVKDGLGPSIFFKACCFFCWGRLLHFWMCTFLATSNWVMPS